MKKKIEIRKRIAEINARFTALADSLESEKRGLTQEEIEEKRALTSEKEILELRYQQIENGWVPSQEVENRGAAFAGLIHGIINRSLPAGYEKLVQSEKEIIIPATRSYQDVASSGAIIPLTIGEIIEPLEKGMILSAVGAKMQYGLTGDWVFPVVAGIEATIEGENTEVSDTTIDITSIKPQPKRVALAVPVSNSAIDQSNGLLLDIVNGQIQMGLARLLNRWMFAPEKISVKASDGCFVAPKSSMVTTAYSYKDVVALKGRVMKKGVIPDGTAAYVCSASTYADLEATPRNANGGDRMILEDGKINGYPVFVTEYVGEGVLGFGIFSYEMVGQFGQMRLTVDPYTGSKKNVTYFVLNTSFDMLSLRAEAFGICKLALSGAPTIASDPTSVELKSAASVAVKTKINVTGVNLTAAVGAALSGTNAALFAVSAATMAKDANGAVNAELEITYTPAAAGNHVAALTLSSTGATSVVVNIAGVCK